jgi:methanogenic corrinoid protein MtbC1
VQPERTCTNIRFYTDCHLKHLLNVSILNKHGYKISEIARLTEKEIAERVMNISMNPGDFETQIESLVVAMIELDEVKFEKILGSAILNLGFEETLSEIIFPFFYKIGFLWQTGSIVPAQEHFISNLIRQKLIVGIDGIPFSSPSYQKTFILYLHEKELHEIGLLTFYYLLKKRKHKVIYLGQSVPFEDLVTISSIHKPYAMLTSFTSGISQEDLQNYLDKLAQHFPGVRHFVSGLQLTDPEIIPTGFFHIRQIAGFLEALDAISV